VAIGFSLGFGAMFSKTWRVHVIFLNATNTKRVITTVSYLLFVINLNLDVLIIKTANKVLLFFFGVI